MSLFGFTGRTKIQEIFEENGLNPDVSFAAMDSDVIKSYVRLGYGVGIIANMSYSEVTDKDLVMRDLSQLFPQSTARVAYIKQKYMKTYLKDCVELMINNTEDAK